MDSLEALVTRSSAKTYGESPPTKEDLAKVLQAAVRAPDHGRLRPWRFMLIEGEQRMRFGEMLAAFHKGDVAEAVRINQGLIESYEFESSEEAPNPVPTKAMLRVLGLKVGQCRAPMGVAPDWLEPRAREVLAGLS